MNDAASPIAPLAGPREVHDRTRPRGRQLPGPRPGRNPHRSVPFVFSHHLDHRGQVVLQAATACGPGGLRDQYARWYWANGVRPGEPVGVVIAEGLPPILHFLALSALGADPHAGQRRDAARHHGALPRPRRGGRRGGRRPDPVGRRPTGRDSSAPRFIALTAEVRGHDPSPARCPSSTRTATPPTRSSR